MESLARHAVFSGLPSVRDAAIAALKQRPLDAYVPLLLSGLHSPIEAAVATHRNGPLNRVLMLALPRGTTGRRFLLF